MYFVDTHLAVLMFIAKGMSEIDLFKKIAKTSYEQHAGKHSVGYTKTKNCLEVMSSALLGELLLLPVAGFLSFIHLCICRVIAFMCCFCHSIFSHICKLL